MKKLFIFAALAFGLVSCQNDTNIFGVEVTPDEKPVEYTISVGIPELDQTRAGYTNSGEGAIANGVLGLDNDNVTLRYILGVYIYDTTTSTYKLAGSHHTEYSDNCTVNFKPTLVPNRKYNFVVWVDIVTKVDGEWVNDLYNVDDLAAVTINDANWKPMDEMRDAFTGFTTVDDITASVGTPTSPITVNCTRPFAKVRVITEDMDVMQDFGIVPSKAEITYATSYRHKFNATTGEYTDADVANIKTHGMFAIADYSSNGNVEGKALFTDYLFAPYGTDVIGFTMDVYDSTDKLIKSTTFSTDIPVKRNTLTTITGNFLTLQEVNLQVNVENNGSFTGEDGVKDNSDDEITKEL